MKSAAQRKNRKPRQPVKQQQTEDQSTVRKQESQSISEEELAYIQWGSEGPINT
jgi:hypothetical protein